METSDGMNTLVLQQYLSLLLVGYGGVGCIHIDTILWLSESDIQYVDTLLQL